jgi:hypothetical protein
MNISGYAYGVFTFFTGTQAGERSPVFGIVFALVALLCLVIASSKIKSENLLIYANNRKGVNIDFL